jgi:hypothetical protein
MNCTHELEGAELWPHPGIPSCNPMGGSVLGYQPKHFYSRFKQKRVILHIRVYNVVVNSDTFFHIQRPRQNLNFFV